MLPERVNVWDPILVRLILPEILPMYVVLETLFAVKLANVEELLKMLLLDISGNVILLIAVASWIFLKTWSFPFKLILPGLLRVVGANPKIQYRY